MSSTPQTDWSILVTLPPRSDIPRASDVITECCGSVLMSGVTYEYGRLRVEALAGVADPAAQVAKWRAMEEALKNAITWEGRLNQAEQMLMQGDREAWKKLKLTVQYEMDKARAALAAKGGE